MAETTRNAGGELQKRVAYSLGHDRISQTTTTFAGGQPYSTSTLFFGRDGHGSTRVLLDLYGAVATVSAVRQVFHFTAFGESLGFEAAQAATSFLYAGEQTDGTGLQYLRARYYDPSSGRFLRLDPFAGNADDPQSLHKYLYCHADPVNGWDPTGMMLGIPALMQRYGISAQNSLAALNAIDNLQSAI
ncbi:MAG: RHS repeat-associated core domain-containing protein, partial [Planctomycetota bacterium]